MKKFLSCMVALFAAVSLYAADLNIYASGLKVVPSNGAPVIEYMLNAPATALTVYLRPTTGDPYSVKLTDAALLTKGTHQAQLKLRGVPAGTYTWAIKAEGAPTTFAEATSANDMYRYYLPQDIVVNNNPESPFFGNIYVSESTVGQSDGGSALTKAQKRGIYIYKSDLSFANGDSAAVTAYDGGLGGDTLSRQGFKRLAIDENGFVYVASRDIATKGVYRMDPANPSAAFVTVLNASAPVDALGIYEGHLYTLEGVATASSKLNKYSLATLPIDAAIASMDQAPILKFGNSDCDAAPDGRGGWWFTEHRYGFDANPALVHMTAQGVNDFEISAGNNDLLLSNADGGLSYRGVVAVNPAGNLLAMASNRRAVVFTVSYDETTGVPTLTKLCETGKLGSNVDGVAFDVANNLYVASASAERFYAYPVAQAVNEFTTPAPAANTIEVVATPIVDYIAFQDVPGKTGSDNGNAIFTVTDIVKTGADLVKATADATKIYNAREGMGVKFGTGSATGKMIIRLANPVCPDSIIVTAASYSKNEGAAVLMGDTFDLTADGKNNKVPTKCKKVYDGQTPVYDIVLATSSKRMYVIDVTVYSTSTTPLPAAQAPYQVKHPWGTGAQADWAFQNLEEQENGLWEIVDLYGGTGCNIEPKVLNQEWIADPVLVGNPFVGDSCVFSLNPYTTDTAKILTITKLGKPNYQIKHPWGTGLDADWSFKTCVEQEDGTFALTDFYGGTGCNIKPAVNKVDWIAAPTLIGEPAVGDSCLFIINPAATDTAGILTIKCLVEKVQPVVYRIKHPWGEGDEIWIWKECEMQEDSTWTLTAPYMAEGCNIDPKILDIDYIPQADQTIIGNPDWSDTCVFKINPKATTIKDILTITKVGEPNPPIVVYEHLYEIGDNQGWKPSEAVEMTKLEDENDFQGTFEFTRDTTYFGFITVKPETDDWTITNANRFGPESKDMLVETGKMYNIYKNDNAFKFGGVGKFTIKINLNLMKIHIAKDETGIDNINGDVKIQKVYENGQIYIIRNGEKFTVTGAKVE